MSEEEVTFLKSKLHEKEQSIIDIEKKQRLEQFKQKKQVQEITLQLETEKVKVQEQLDKVQRLQTMINEFQEKAQQQDQLIIKLREESASNQKQQSQKPESNDEFQRFKPRQSLLVRLGTEAQQLPSYGELINVVTKQEGDNSELQNQLQNFQDGAVEAIANRDQTIIELKEQLRACEMRMFELQKNNSTMNHVKESNVDNEQVIQLQQQLDIQRAAQEEEKNKFMFQIKELSDHNEASTQQLAEEIKQAELRYKEEYEQMRNEFEAKSGMKETLLLDQLQQNEEKLHQQEDIINDSRRKMEKEVEKISKELNSVLGNKEKEIRDLSEKLQAQQTKESDLVQKSTNETKQHYEKEMKEINSKLTESINQNDQSQKKLSKLESDKKRLDDLVADYKGQIKDLESEISRKNEKLDSLIESYEEKIMKYVAQLKEEKGKTEMLSSKVDQMERQASIAEDDLSSQLKQSGFANYRMSMLGQASSLQSFVQSNEELNELRDANSNLVQKNERMKVQIEQLVEEIKILDANIDTQKKQISQLQKNDTSEQKAKLKGDESQEAINRLKKENELEVGNLKDEISRLNLDQEKIKSQWDQKLLGEQDLREKHQSESERLILELSNKVDLLQQQLNDQKKISQQSLSELQSSLSQKASEVDSLKLNLSETEAVLQQKLKEIEASQIAHKEAVNNYEKQISKLSTFNSANGAVEMQQEINKLNERERELLLILEKIEEKKSKEQSQNVIKIKELACQVELLKEEIELATDERKYAEEIARRESIKRAEMAMEFEENLQEYRKMYREYKQLKAEKMKK